MTPSNTKNKTISSLMLVLAAMIWGSAFVAQKVGLEYIGAFTFLFVRCLISAAVIAVSYLFIKPIRSKTAVLSFKKTFFPSGMMCGAALAAASYLQQEGLRYTSVGKAGFITTLYIIIVPILSLFSGKKISRGLMLKALGAVFGLYLLSGIGKSEINPGDLLVLLSAFVYAVHIMVIDKYSAEANGVLLSLSQFIFCALICGICAFIFEEVNLSAIFAARVPLLYAGALSGGVAYTLQIVGQKNLEPSVASLLLSLESVFSAIFGFLLLKQTLSLRELIGCAVVFVSVLSAQVTFSAVKKKQ